MLTRLSCFVSEAGALPLNRTIAPSANATTATKTPNRFIGPPRIQPTSILAGSISNGCDSQHRTAEYLSASKWDHQPFQSSSGRSKPCRDGLGEEPQSARRLF